MRNLFEKRLEVKPYEYPELLQFKDAIRHSYWLESEYNFTGDIQDYKVNCTPEEREVIKRAMLAISQIEVGVKLFWGNLYNYFPKPEIADVGFTFAESEVRHKDAYSNLLELLGLNDEFKNIKKIPALMKRINYMEKFMKDKDVDESQFVLSLVLFSMFIEHISLFSQFLILMSFNKHKNMFKGISNAVEATSKEEEIHGTFGLELFKILHIENRELFTDEFYQDLKRLSKEAFKAEMEIVDWIYELGDLDFVPKETVKNYIMQRYNNSLQALGVDFSHKINQELLEETKWFDLEINISKEIDFFNKRSTDYTKKISSSEVDESWF